MRDYYLASTALARMSNPVVKSNGLHWVAMYELVKSYPDEWRPELRKRILNSIENRDIRSLFGVIEVLDSFLTKYERTTPFLTVMLDRQASCFLKKFPFDPKVTPYDPEASALSTWWTSESQCHETNCKIDKLLKGELQSSEFSSLLAIMRRLIYDLLGGELDSKRLIQILAKGTHGPGATATNTAKEGRVTSFYKFNDLPYSCSKSAMPYFTAAISLHPEWVERLESSGRRTEIPSPFSGRAYREQSLVQACTVINEIGHTTFVPKNAKTHRAIEIGNSGNMFCQLAVNSELTTLLESVGINLRDQSINKSWAYKGSRYCYLDDGSDNPNQISTIDMASASDTISTSLLRATWPPTWFALLDDLRLKKTLVDGKEHVLHKFSAMGNGTTFPIESIMFWAASQAAQELFGRVPPDQCFSSVFGDDLIVRYKHAHHVIRAIELCGFKVNQAKSFLRGPFKESCGGDYFQGRDVRPFYLKRPLTTYEDVYNVCNSIAAFIRSNRYAGRLGNSYRAILSAIPVSERTYCPIGVSMSMLQVPLCWMQDRGLSPSLLPKERRLLRKSVFAEFSGKENFEIRQSLLKFLNDPWTSLYWDRTPKSKDFGGNSRMRLFVSLFQKQFNLSPPFWLDRLKRDNWLNDLIASQGGQVTRKGHLVPNVRLAACSSWDGTASRQEILQHPCWGILG